MSVPVFVHPMIVGVRGSRCMGMRLRLSGVCCRRKTVNELDTHDAVLMRLGSEQEEHFGNRKLVIYWRSTLD